MRWAAVGVSDIVSQRGVDETCALSARLSVERMMGWTSLHLYIPRLGVGWVSVIRGLTNMQTMPHAGHCSQNIDEGLNVGAGICILTWAKTEAHSENGSRNKVLTTHLIQMHVSMRP